MSPDSILNSNHFCLDKGVHFTFQQAWAIVEPVFKKEREAGSARYRQLAGTGQTTTDVTEAVLAAHHGRIEVLFKAVSGLDPKSSNWH